MLIKSNHEFTKLLLIPLGHVVKRRAYRFAFLLFVAGARPIVSGVTF